MLFSIKLYITSTKTSGLSSHTWLNWSLKFHSRLRTIPHLIYTHYTQDFCSMNAYFICVIVHVQMWCVYLIACRSNPNFFWVFYMFFKVFLCFRVLSFVQIEFFMFFIKNSFKGIFARSSWVSSSRENGLGKEWKHQILDKNFCDCLTTALRVKATRKFLCFKGIFLE